MNINGLLLLLLGLAWPEKICCRRAPSHSSRAAAGIKFVSAAVSDVALFDALTPALLRSSTPRIVFLRPFSFRSFFPANSGEKEGANSAAASSSPAFEMEWEVAFLPSFVPSFSLFFFFAAGSSLALWGLFAGSGEREGRN